MAYKKWVAFLLYFFIFEKGGWLKQSTVKRYSRGWGLQERIRYMLALTGGACSRDNDKNKVLYTHTCVLFTFQDHVLFMFMFLFTFFRSHFLFRAFYIPFISSQFCEYANYNVLKTTRVKKKRKQH